MTNNKNIPLSVAVEQARFQIISFANKVIAESKLPAYMLESVFLEILSDIRESKVRELTSEYLRVTAGDGKEEKSDA